MSHTPGEWKLWTSNGWRQIRSTDYEDKGRIHNVVLGNPDSDFNLKVSDADARLICAAPEMLETLKIIHDFLVINHLIEWNSKVKESLHNAISKATGEK